MRIGPSAVEFEPKEQKRPWDQLYCRHCEEIERAFRLLASENHPDKGGDPDRMARINRARDALLEQLQ